MDTRFDRDTAVRAAAEGVFSASIDAGWFVARGPNGGYVAALMLRALTAAVDDPGRTPRSLTVHFTAPPRAGPVLVHTAIERRGRSLSTASARLLQEGRLLALALAAFSTARDAPDFDETRRPDAPEPAACPRSEARIPIHERYEARRVFGAEPFSGADRAEGGGWIRLAEGDRPLDAPLIAAYADAWPPALLARLVEQRLAGGMPTVDLTVHFRETPVDLRSRDYALLRFRTRLAHQGFVGEDGEIWSRDGRLLAQSRQLALML